MEKELNQSQDEKPDKILIEDVPQSAGETHNAGDNPSGMDIDENSTRERKEELKDFERNKVKK